MRIILELLQINYMIISPKGKKVNNCKFIPFRWTNTNSRSIDSTVLAHYNDQRIKKY